MKFPLARVLALIKAVQLHLVARRSPFLPSLDVSVLSPTRHNKSGTQAVSLPSGTLQIPLRLSSAKKKKPRSLTPQELSAGSICGDEHFYF